MSVKSVFAFHFPEAAFEEGLSLAKAIGNDMLRLDGYVDHEVIQDVADPGHILLATSWASQPHAAAMLGTYKNDAKIKRVIELLPEPPRSFIAAVLK